MEFARPWVTRSSHPSSHPHHTLITPSSHPLVSSPGSGESLSINSSSADSSRSSLQRSLESSDIMDMRYSCPFQYRPPKHRLPQYCRPFQVPNYRVFKGYTPVSLPIPTIRNTAGFSPVPRTAVLGKTTVYLVLPIFRFFDFLVGNDLYYDAHNQAP